VKYREIKHSKGRATGETAVASTPAESYRLTFPNWTFVKLLIICEAEELVPVDFVKL
jgi:hypothetical protein